MLAPEAQRAFIGWEPINSRIITAKFITKKKDIKLNIIQCYAPTNDAAPNLLDANIQAEGKDRPPLFLCVDGCAVFVDILVYPINSMSCRIAHAGQLSESFEVKTRVRQGCLLSPFLFLLVIDWIMKTTTTGRKNGIQWTLWTQLDDLDFADDLALLSHSHSQMQDKTTCLEATSAGTGLKINRKKTELMKINTTANTSHSRPTLLKQHFQPVYKYDPKVLLQLHEGVVTELNAKIQEEVAVMFEEESISDFMVKLDQLRRQSDGSAAGDQVDALKLTYVHTCGQCGASI
nr:hypothetical protein BaRGS_029960 [Batillaria attramentaria]